MAASKLKVGVVGLGVGSQHLDAYRSHPDVEVAAICDISPEVLSRFEIQYPGLMRTLNPNELIEDPEISIVSVCSPDDAHHDQVVRALNAGKHVFVEKPLCLYPEHAKEIRSLLDKKPELRLSSNLIMRRYPRFLELRRLLREGSLGQPYYLEGDYNYGRVEKILTGWRGQVTGYSPLLGGGIHIVDMMLWLLEKKPVEVFAFTNKIATAGTSFTNYDLITALLKFEDGVLAKIAVNLGCVYPHFHRFQLYGTKGTFENDFEFARLFRKRDPHKDFEKIETPYPGVAKGGLLDDFIDAIKEGRSPAVDKEEIFKSLSVCFAIEESVAKKASVQVNYI